MKPLRAIAMVLAGVVFVAACSAAPEEVSDSSTKALEFTAETLSGEPFSGKSLAGKPAVLWFWTPWCAICQFEAGFIADMAEQHGDRATFVGVAAQDDVDAMRAFAKRYGIDAFTNLNDANGAVWARFEVPAQPAFAFISASGKVERVNGTITEQDFVRWLDTRAGF